jgi:heme/copper-type cytochrome/quinol oxidase subunit 2
MKQSTFYPASIVLLSLVPSITNAQLADSASAGQLEEALTNILVVTNTTLIPFIVGIAFLFFVFGVFRYFILGGADEEKRAQGRSFVVTSIVFFVLIIIFFGVVNMFTESTGLDGEMIENIPQVRPI